MRIGTSEATSMLKIKNTFAHLVEHDNVNLKLQLLPRSGTSVLYAGMSPIL